MSQPRLTVVYLDLTAGFAYVLKALQVGVLELSAEKTRCFLFEKLRNIPESVSFIRTAGGRSKRVVFRMMQIGGL